MLSIPLGLVLGFLANTVRIKSDGTRTYRSTQSMPLVSTKRSTAAPYQVNGIASINRGGKEKYSEASKNFLSGSVGDTLSFAALVVLESLHGLNRI